MRIYAACNCDGKTLERVREWIEILRRACAPHGLEVVSWLPDDLTEATRHDQDPREVVNRDLELIRDCDVLVAMLDFPSMGCACEMLYAHQNDVPVVVMTSSKTVADHYWIRALAAIVDYSIESYERCAERVVEHTWRYRQPSRETANEAPTSAVPASVGTHGPSAPDGAVCAPAGGCNARS